MKKDKKIKIGKSIHTLVCIFLIIYIAFLMWRMFFYAYGNYYRSQGSISNINLIPFKTIINYIKGIGEYKPNIVLYNLLGNIVIFVPLGIMLPVISNRLRRLECLILSSLITIFLFEFLQMYTRVGTFDIDDIILNIIGILIGYIIIIKILKLNKI